MAEIRDIQSSRFSRPDSSSGARRHETAPSAGAPLRIAPHRVADGESQGSSTVGRRAVARLFSELARKDREIHSLKAHLARLQPKAESLERIFRAADYGTDALYEQLEREENS